MKWRYMFLGALLAGAVLLLGAQAVRDAQVGTFQMTQGLSGPVVIDTRSGQLYDSDGNAIGHPPVTK